LTTPTFGCDKALVEFALLPKVPKINRIDSHRVYGVRSSERLLTLANIDRIAGLSMSD
jgi:hypothetical protein